MRPGRLPAWPWPVRRALDTADRDGCPDRHKRLGACAYQVDLPGIAAVVRAADLQPDSTGVVVLYPVRRMAAACARCLGAAAMRFAKIRALGMPVSGMAGVGQ